jgi:flagellar motility protein MotE (MotC chaperone)
MNAIKSAAALATVAVALALSGCASLQPTESNDILASMSHDSLGGE